MTVLPHRGQARTNSTADAVETELVLKLAGLLSGPGLTLSTGPVFLAERSCSSSRTRLSNTDTLSVTAEQSAQDIVKRVYRGCVDCSERQRSNELS